MIETTIRRRRWAGPLAWSALAVPLVIAVFLVMTILEDGFNLGIPTLIFPLTLMAIPVSMAIADRG